MKVFNLTDVRQCINETADCQDKKIALAFLDDHVKSNKELNQYWDSYDADRTLQLAEAQLTGDKFYGMCLLSWAINKRTYELDTTQGFRYVDEASRTIVIPEHPVDQQYVDRKINLVADYIYALCDETAKAELRKKEAHDSLNAAILRCMDHCRTQLFEYLYLAALSYSDDKEVHLIINFTKDPEIEGWVAGKTESGTSLALIAKFMLCQQDMGTWMNYDDKMHFWLLNDGLTNADPVLLQYLSNMVEHNAQYVSA